jgi:hypothetical protein
MKKFILMFATLCFITFSANSQTKKGTVLLGAGSEFSQTEWTQWMITPKIGYFIQDGLAIGAEIHFDTDDEYFPSFPGTVSGVDTDGDGIDDDWVSDNNGHSDYTLTSNVSKFGVFARYYAARNLFMEVSLSSMTTRHESWEKIVTINTQNPLAPPTSVDAVVQERTSSNNVRFGMGYTLVWREHFAVEPYVHLDLIVDGERVAAVTNETTDLSGTEFIGGVNFSLFF